MIKKARDLCEIPLYELSSNAHKLARLGHITGEAALCLIVWPRQEDMIRYVLRLRHIERELEELIAA